MPNWTYNIVNCEGISEMDIFTEVNGVKEFDFNKIIPRPEYLSRTISPMMPRALLAYLVETEKAPVDDLCRKVNEMIEEERVFTGSMFSKFFSTDEIKLIMAMSENELSAYLKEDFLLLPEERISAVELGKNYATAFKETGCFDWYSWSCKYWGVKWNASDTVINDNYIEFYTPRTLPVPVLRALSLKYPDKEFRIEVNFEGELIDALSCCIKNGEVYNAAVTEDAPEGENEED